MSLRTANRLTLGGFCVFYCGLMGTLMAINVPVDSHTAKLAILFLVALAFMGMAAMLVGRLTKVDDRCDERDTQIFPIDHL